MALLPPMKRMMAMNEHATSPKNAKKVKPHELPVDLRLEHIQRIFVKHDGIAHARKVLERTFKYGLRLREAQTGYIIGHSRCGKSETVKRFIETKTGKRVQEKVFFQLIEGNGIKIAYADLTNGATPLVASQMLLDELFKDIKTKKLKEGQAAGRIVEQFLLHDVDMFIIDEAQQVFRGKVQGAEDKLAKLANWLLTLENSRSVRILLVGAPELERLFHLVDPTNERKGAIAYLKPFAFQTADDKVEFASFVEAFVADLPFASTCLTNKGRCDDEMLHYLFYATRGRAGGFSKLIEAATIEAFEDARTKGCPEKLGGCPAIC
jgi:hypothetical protein